MLRAAVKAGTELGKKAKVSGVRSRTCAGAGLATRVRTCVYERVFVRAQMRMRECARMRAHARSVGARPYR